VAAQDEEREQEGAREEDPAGLHWRCCVFAMKLCSC
jgi:hypothetical protein